MTLTPTTLGNGLTVSPLGFGGMAVTDVYGRTEQNQALATLNAVVDMGISFIDTADVYGTPHPGTTGPAGTNEELIAHLLKERRQEVTIATKFGIRFLSADGAELRSDPTYVREACEASLRRLGVDTIDLYYLHRRNLDVPLEDTVGAMAELVAEGKVRHLGLSEVTATELAAAHAVHPIAAVQSEWSLWSRDVENYVVPACAELGVGFVPYSPLGRGFLTGALSPQRVKGTALEHHLRFTDHYEANEKAVAPLYDVAAEVSATPAQVALAWLYHQGRRFGVPVVPIPGSRHASRMQENLGSLNISLSEDQLARLDSIAAAVHGGRDFTFTPPGWSSTDRE